MSEHIAEYFDYPILATYSLLGNTLAEYLVALVIFAIGLVVLGTFKVFVLRRLAILAEKSQTDIDDTLIEIVKQVNPPFYGFIAFYIAFRTLTLPTMLTSIVTAIVLLWITHLVIKAVNIFVNRVIKARLGEDDGSAQAAVQLLSAVLTVVLWALGILLMLQNVGFNVTSLIAGLGIGGVAIAFALQSILGDLFSSFSIVFDKPFAVGDFIVVGDTVGTVEKIGIKTSRIRALSGEEIVLSNTDLTSSRIQNYKRMEQRRVVFGFGVTYETPVEKLKMIPQMVMASVERQEGTHFDRAHFTEFGDSAYVYEAVYYVHTGDYAVYARTHETICLDLITRLEKEGIEMAYPTQTLYVTHTGDEKTS